MVKGVRRKGERETKQHSQLPASCFLFPGIKYFKTELLKDHNFKQYSQFWEGKLPIQKYLVQTAQKRNFYKFVQLVPFINLHDKRKSTLCRETQAATVGTDVLQQSDKCIVGSQKYLWTSYEINFRFSPCILTINHFYYPTNALNYTSIKLRD